MRKAAFKGQEVQNKGKIEALDHLNRGGRKFDEQKPQQARATGRGRGRGKYLPGLVIRGLLISRSLYTP